MHAALVLIFMATVYFGGQAYSKIYFAGRDITSLVIRGQVYHAADRPGTLAVSVTRSGRDYNFVFSVTDPDGIRSLTSATVTARDGTNANALGDFSRSNANSFAGTDSRRNARWSSGTMTVVYVDATSGQSVTLSMTWTT